MIYNIKYKIPALAIMLLLALQVTAQPTWDVHPPDYQYSMTITGLGIFSCVETNDESDLVAAFIDGECRGVQSFGTDVDGQKIAYLIIYDNAAVGSELTFKLYDASEDVIHEAVYTAEFEENASYGNAETPYEFKTEYGLTELFLENDILYENALQGELVTQVMTINENGDTIALAVDFQDDSLGMDNGYFTTTDNSLLLEVDVDYPVKDRYEIHLAVASPTTGCTIDKNFTITVINTNIAPGGLTETQVTIPENQPVGSLVTLLVALDDSPDDSHIFELEGDPDLTPDLTAFEIINNEVLSEEVFDYETKNEYNIQVKITDNNGNTFIENLKVLILDVIEFENLKASNLITPNEDGFNDYFEIPNVHLFNNYRLAIFNNNGNEVYAVEGNYDNTWNGLTINGKELPSGTYYYLLRDKSNSKNSFIGNLHLHRANKF